ncbi:hypothetical protein ACLOJK_023930, partial [Asimina triloba]
MAGLHRGSKTIDAPFGQQRVRAWMRMTSSEQSTHRRHNTVISKASSSEQNSHCARHLVCTITRQRFGVTRHNSYVSSPNTAAISAVRGQTQTKQRAHHKGIRHYVIHMHPG